MTTDQRRIGLRDGLRQLTLAQLERLRDYDGEMVLDRWNYHDGRYCPLSVALGLDEVVKEPTHEKVYAILALSGYSVNNTWGREGEFYTTSRYGDLMTVVDEVIEEKRKEDDLEYQAMMEAVWDETNAVTT